MGKLVKEGKQIHDQAYSINFITMQDFFFQKINQNKCVELDERVTVENKPEKQAQRVTKKFEN